MKNWQILDISWCRISSINHLGPFWPFAIRSLAARSMSYVQVLQALMKIVHPRKRTNDNRKAPGYEDVSPITHGDFFPLSC